MVFRFNIPLLDIGVNQILGKEAITDKKEGSKYARDKFAWME
jgi:hypothetical protein